MKALIIASGQGLRLKGRGDVKPLVPLLGLPLIERVILSAREAGIREFVVVVGYKGDEVTAFLEGLEARYGLSIRTVRNDEWQKENGLSVLKAKDVLRDDFLLLMGDHIFDPAILRRLIEEGVKAGEVVLAVDRRVRDNPYVDMGDVTKVLVDKGGIKAIGKDLDSYNAFDTGIFLCTPALFDAIAESIERGDTTLSGGIRVLARRGKARAFDIGDGYWVDVDDEEAFRRAEEVLLSTLRKASDGPVSRLLNRPISIRITRRLLYTGITPNELSLISFAVCVLGALAFLIPGYGGLLLGGILAQTASILDGCDGEVARLKYMRSDFGGWFDAVLDRYADAFLIIGLTFHVYEGRDLFPLLVGFFALTGTFMNSYTADKYDGLMRRLVPEGGYFRVGRDVRLFIIFIGALAGRPLLLLLVIALAMNLETIRRVWLLYREASLTT